LALPIKIAAPWLRVVLIESKQRKAAFLREAVGQLGLLDVEVEARRADALLTRNDLACSADLVTVRAVRLDEELSRIIGFLLRPAGSLIGFGADGPKVIPR